MVTLEVLVAPITVENPVGIDLRQDNSANSFYYKIKDARNAARDKERQMILDQNTPKFNDWELVLNLCESALLNMTKDLEIVCWYIEAIFRQQGFLGLAHGFELARQLVAYYWDTIYPLPDADNLETRFAALIGLNGGDFEGSLIQPVYHQSITQGVTAGPFALWQYKQAIENSKLTNKALIETRRSQNALFMDKIYIAVQETPSEFYKALQNDIKAAMKSFIQLHEFLIEKCGEKAPPKNQICNALEQFHEHVQFIVNEMSNSTNEMNTEVNAVEISTPIAINLCAENFHSREQALAQLAKIASFFRKVEPQSPMPYLLDRTIYLGKLSFPELLNALINDEVVRNSAYELLGMKK
jgi:type VI secretion system protein ImpA